ncbi:MAG: hypothetical protein ACERKZ_02470 [Lachnotalea sp.]
MLEKIKFINHINESIEWGTNGIYVNYNDLRDYSWDFTSDNNKISSFSKGIVTKTIPITIMCSSESEGLAIKNRLFEITEKDVLAMQHGKIIIGEHYLKCFITGSKKSDYLINKRFLKTSLTLKTDYPQWVKETTTSFRTTEGISVQEPQGKRNFDYNFDFSFDYTSEMKNKTLNNTGFVETNFKLIIYGACINPAIHISGHTYQVKCEVSDNEYLTINSLTQKIILTRYDGTEVNCFNYRNRNSYIFKPIPSGNNIVTWNYDFGFDVVLLEERSEPKWT